MSIVFFIFSFLLEGIVYSCIETNSIAIPLFSLLSLVLIYPYFNNKNVYFLTSSLILGFFYDIIYTNTLFMNTFAFGIIAILIIKVFTYLTRNVINTYLVSLIVLVFYRVVIFLFLALIQAIEFDLLNLLYSITNSLLINTLYISIFYFLLCALSNKLKIKKIR